MCFWERWWVRHTEHPVGTPLTRPASPQDLDLEDEVPIERVPEKQIDDAVKADEARSKRTDPTRDMILRKLGFCAEKAEGDAY